LLLFKKNETVTGNIAYKHGCSTEINPQRNPSKKVFNKERSAVEGGLTSCAKIIVIEKHKTAANKNFKFLILWQDKKIG
jgi:hypothetical protein